MKTDYRLLRNQLEAAYRTSFRRWALAVQSLAARRSEAGSGGELPGTTAHDEAEARYRHSRDELMAAIQNESVRTPQG